MTFDGLEIQPMAILTGIWLVILIAIVTFLVKFWPLIKGFVTAVENLKELPAFMKRTDDYIEESIESQKRQDDELHALSDLTQRIRHQVENDHDTNLRDDVTDALVRIDQITAWTGRHEILSDEHRDQVAKLKAWVTEHDQKEHT